VRIIGPHVVEVTSAYDHAEITSVTASRVACDLVSLLAVKEKP
jgi:arginase family enzyme